MRVVAFSSFFIFIFGCTVYQSDGRQAIEKNKANIVGTFGFDPYHKVDYRCEMGGDAPDALHSPTEVIESEFEASGYSSFLIKKYPHKEILVYRYDPNSHYHHICRLHLMSDSDADQKGAIRLAVNLLQDQSAGL